MTEAEKNKLIRMESEYYVKMRNISKELGRNNLTFETARGKWLGVYEVCCEFGLGERITDEE